MFNISTTNDSPAYPTTTITESTDVISPKDDPFTHIFTTSDNGPIGGGVSMETLVESPHTLSIFFSALDLATVLIFLGTLGLLLSVWRQRPHGLPPGPPRIPIIGSTALFSSSDPAQVLVQLRRRYGDIFSLYVGNKMLIFLNGYHNFREAFITNPDLFTNKASTFITEKLGQGKGK